MVAAAALEVPDETESVGVAVSEGPLAARVDDGELSSELEGSGLTTLLGTSWPQFFFRVALHTSWPDEFCRLAWMHWLNSCSQRKVGMV